MPRVSLVITGILAAVVAASPLEAQEYSGFVPYGVADADAPYISGRMLLTDLLAEDVRDGIRVPTTDHGDLQAFVTLGTALPFVSVSPKARLGVEVAVHTRYRMETHRKDQLSNDWMVAIPVVWRGDRTEAVVRLGHESAHLGDEAVQYYGITRQSFDHEYLDFAVFRRIQQATNTRVYASVRNNWRSSLPDDGLEFTVGSDAEWGSGDIVQAGLHGHFASRTSWRPAVSARIAIARPIYGRLWSIGLEASKGPTSVGELYQLDEITWGVGLRVIPR